MDANTLVPIRDAVVSRHNETLDRHTITTTDDDGEFVFKKDRDFYWVVGVALVACDVAYQAEAPGYWGFSTNMLAHRSPHDLGTILMFPRR